MRIRTLLVLVGIAASTVACTSLLGDFSVSTDGVGSDDDGGNEGGTVASCSAPGAPQCGSHGTCDDASGTAVCTCALGYAGPGCSTCAEGYQGSDGGSTCEPKCDVACPAHGACVVANGKGACVCAPGYTGAACTWTGGPTDPGLEAPPPSPWEVVGGAIDPAAEGRTPNEKGLFIVPTASLCSTPPVIASLAQSVAMPSVSQGEPFALKIVGRTYCDPTADPTCYGTAGYETALSFPGTFFLAPKVWTEQEICLGEKGYGPATRVAITGIRPDPGGHPGLCYNTMPADRRELQIDSVRIAPSLTCPAVGTVANGDFEGDGVWKATAGASVEAGIGEKGSRAGRMKATDGCPGEAPSLESSISVPTASLPNAELTFKFKGSPERLLSVGIGPGVSPGRVAPVTVKGNGTYQSVSMCLPEFAKGYAVPFRLVMGNETACGEGAERELVVDELKITSQPSRCAANVFIADGGFEKAYEAGGVSFWQFSSAAGPPLRSTAGFSTGSTVHGGARMATMTGYQTCYTADARTPITIPPAKGTSGPVARFFYRVRNPNAVVVYRADANADVGASTSLTLPQPGYVANTWAEAKLCLPPGRPNRAATLTFGLSSPTTCNQVINPAPSFDVDDVTIAADPACPAN